MSRENNPSRSPWEEPSRETAYEAHLRRKREKQRSRQSKPTFPSNKDGLTTDRLSPSQGQRSRHLETAGEDTPETERLPPSSGQRFRSRPEYRADAPAAPPRSHTAPAPRRTGEPEWEEADRQAQQARTKPRPPTRAKPRSRGFGSTLLIGCLGGLITIGLIVAIVVITILRTPLGSNLLGGITTRTYTQPTTQVLHISNLTFAQIDNQIGNVTFTVDPSVAAPTLITTKKVTAASNAAANQEFARIIVSVVKDPVLKVAVTLPNSNGASGDAVDVVVKLPPALSGNTAKSMTIIASTVGGDVNVQQVQLAADSCLQTNKGNVTFNGTLDTTNSSTLIPCEDTSTTQPHPWYRFHSEVGNLDVTLPATLNIILDASTNVGKINSNEFNLNISNQDNSASYHGPLISGSTQPAAELKLDVGTGSISLHQA